MNKLFVVNGEAKQEQNADRVRVGKIGWLADFIEKDGEGYHGYYLEKGNLVQRPDLLNELMTFNKDAMEEKYHEASPEEVADFQARKK